jgi:cell wall-associated NlpC family hydrolase
MMEKHSMSLIVRNLKLLMTFFIPLIVLLLFQPCFALTDEEIQRFQTFLKGSPVGERIAFWAEKFVGVPYDMDPLGEYVSKASIVADERVDCMYLTFRAVELALSKTPDEAIQIALEKRFRSKGVLKEGQVINYDDRFEYGEDMIESGKWGKEITSVAGKMTRIKGSRGKDFVEVLLADELVKNRNRLQSGDIIFFATQPEKRKVGEIIGHIGIVKIEKRSTDPGAAGVYLIHASGVKGKGGLVKKVLLKDYLSKMPFIGVKITRFE